MINTIYTFALGKGTCFGERIDFIETDIFLDFNEDVKGYGYKLYNHIDTDFDKASILNFSIISDNELNGTIEFKSNNPNETFKSYFKLCSGKTDIDFLIPTLSSKLSEVIVYFPKELNIFEDKDILPSIRFEKITIV